MADNTLSKLTELIASADSPELREAALRVAGHVGAGQNRPLAQAILKALEDPMGELRQQAVVAVGLLRIEEALPSLEAFVRQGGNELEPAVQSATQLGAKGAKVIGKLMDQVAPSVRSRIAAVLAKSGTGGALVVTAQTLLDADPKVAEAAARSLAMEVPNFTPSQKQALGKFLVEALEDRKKPTTASEAALLRVLGTLHDARAADVLWSRLAPNVARDVRVAALQALGNQPGQLTDAKVKKLLACASDRDFQLVAPAITLLRDVPVGKKDLKPWLQLLEAPDVACRRFAVDKLKGVQTKQVVEAFLKEMDHPDRALREEVQQILGGFAAGRDALLERLLASENSDQAWSLARTLAPRFTELSTKQRDLLFKDASAAQDKEDRRAAPLWFFLRELDPRGTRDRIEERAQSLRKRQKYAEALAYYRLLTQDPACSEDIRFELAATGLKTSARDVALDARQSDLALTQFARLLQNPAFDVAGKITKAKWLEPEELFYLGFHFIEQQHRAREFGKQVLELVVTRSPKSEIGKSAKRKLKSQG